MPKKPSKLPKETWNMTAVIIDHKKPNSYVELRSLMDEGFEPFSVVFCGEGYSIFLKRKKVE